MTTISTQQVLDYVLEQISKDFDIDHAKLVEKYSSIQTISAAIQPIIDNNKNTKVKRVLKKSSVVTPVETVQEVVETPIESPKKKVVRKVTKVLVVGEAEATKEVVPELVETPIDPPKKKVVRKVTKASVVPKVETTPTPSNLVESLEEKVKPQPKRIVKKAPQTSDNVAKLEVVEEPSQTPEKQLDIDTVYTDSQIYNDEDSDSLEPREVNGIKYYIDSSNYVYHVETQDLIGKLNEKGDNIIFLSDFSTEKHD
jgi:hypothetical protein